MLPTPLVLQNWPVAGQIFELSIEIESRIHTLGTREVTCRELCGQAQFGGEISVFWTPSRTHLVLTQTCAQPRGHMRVAMDMKLFVRVIGPYYKFQCIEKNNSNVLDVCQKLNAPMILRAAIILKIYQSWTRRLIARRIREPRILKYANFVQSIFSRGKVCVHICPFVYIL